MRALPSLSAALLLFAAACMPGQKLLSLEVVRGEEVLLVTAFDVVDTSTEAEMWDSAGEVPSSTRVSAIAPSGADPLKAELEGPVQIRILWTDRLECSATLDGLRLVRSGPGAHDWRLPPEEIRRAKVAAGI